MEIGLNEKELSGIKQVLARHSQVEEAILYGSRAKGTFMPASDIDITLLGTALDLTLQQVIEQELDDLLLPYKIDLSIYHDITNQDLKEHIKRVGKVLFRKGRNFEKMI